MKITSRIVAHYFVSTLGISLVIWVYFRWLHVNETTVALTFLVLILLVASRWGLRHSIYLSLLSAAAFNFFFLPPVFTFTVRDPRNWVALLAFIISGAIGSRLAEKAKEEAEDARSRQRETEKLYDLSQTMLLAGNTAELLNSMPRRIETIFNLDGVAVYLLAGERTYRSRPDFSESRPGQLRDAAFSRHHVIDSEHSLTLVPILLGTRTLGSLAVSGIGLSPEVLDAVCGLAAIAVERASAMETITRVEASRESERLRNALLDSVTLELKEPLESIAAAIQEVRKSEEKFSPQTASQLENIDLQSERLTYLVRQSMEMAELETHEIRLDLQIHTISEVLVLALSDAENLLKARKAEVRLPADLPVVRFDLKRIIAVLQHLLSNAAKYSPAGSPIFISAEATASDVMISVADRGTGIEDMEKVMIFDKFFRGKGQRTRVQGTGMGLAIARAIVQAHGGSMHVTSQPGVGSVFSFTLPLEQRQEDLNEAKSGLLVRSE